MSRGGMKTNRFTDKEIETLIKLYNEDKTPIEIGKILKRTPKSISSKKDRLFKENPELFFKLSKKKESSFIYRSSQEAFELLEDVNKQEISTTEILKKYSLNTEKELTMILEQAKNEILEHEVPPFDFVNFLKEMGNINDNIRT